MATPDNGAFAALYAASEAKIKVGDGTEVVFSELTNYPFQEKVEIRLSMNNPVKFPLYLRVPEWCKKAAVEVNGELLDGNPEPGKAVRLERKWKSGDQITLTLPMEVRIRHWAKNHNSISVNYGPLTFSLNIKENYIRRESDQTAIGDSKWQKDVDRSKWPSWEIYPDSDWNYGLVLDKTEPGKALKVEKKTWPESNFPFTIADVPIVIKAKARQIPEWKLDQYGMCGELVDSPVSSDQPEIEVELIPMGAARLRISSFPVIK